MLSQQHLLVTGAEHGRTHFWTINHWNYPGVSIDVYCESAKLTLTYLYNITTWDLAIYSWFWRFGSQWQGQDFLQWIPYFLGGANKQENLPQLPESWWFTPNPKPRIQVSTRTKNPHVIICAIYETIPAMYMYKYKYIYIYIEPIKEILLKNKSVLEVSRWRQLTAQPGDSKPKITVMWNSAQVPPTSNVCWFEEASNIQLYIYTL